MSKDAELRLRAEIIRELKAEVKRLREEVGFWAGEGQQLRPEMAEYRKLVTENTTQAKARVRELAEMFRIEVEDAPELRERLTELRTENERLRKRHKAIAMHNTYLEVINKASQAIVDKLTKQLAEAAEAAPAQTPSHSRGRD